MKNISVKRIKVDDKREFFRYWLEFLKPYHKMAPREVEAMAILLYYRNELSKEIKSKKLVDKMLFSSDIRLQIRKDLGGMRSGVFNNLLTVLRRKGVLKKDNTIIDPLIPNMDPESDEFTLIFKFEIDEKNKG